MGNKEYGVGVGGLQVGKASGSFCAHAVYTPRLGVDPDRPWTGPGGARQAMDSRLCTSKVSWVILLYNLCNREHVGLKNKLHF